MSALDATTSVLICGVGGQGNLLAGDLLAKTAAASGLEVSLAEVHGMAQRGGSVDTLVRFGSSVFSPLICEGEADFLVGFEELEAVRWSRFLRPEGTLVVARTRIAPLAVLLGKTPYPEGSIDALAERWRVIAVEADAIAREEGDPRSANVVLLGTLSALLPFEERTWRDTIVGRVPAQTVEVNLRAFARGRALV